jgi:predicted Zn-dependent protease
MGAGPEIGGMASAFILASQSVGTNALMAFRRSEESAADAAALRYLEATGQSGRGMVEILQYLKGEEAAGYSPYIRTHPDAGARIDQVKTKAMSLSNWNKKGSARDNTRLDLARAKVLGFLESRQTVINSYPNSDKSLAGRYARIITAYKAGAGATAIPIMADLAASAPDNPYFQELLGQMYLETGNAKKAVAPLARAVRLAPKEPLIRVLYGQALLATDNKANIEEAVLQLKRAAIEDSDSILAYTTLSRAYAALGNLGEADLAAAEAAMARGDRGTALGLARKAQKNLKDGSPAWLRADDILSLAR